MYQQKFMPYNQMNEVYEEEEYEEENSEPLIEEVDPDYEPTEKEVKEYAVGVLGMSFPEDERLLYLAREGLKAPIPENWQPYQGRDGEVYYKHKITQEKTLEHPTDVEYRKRYTQEKERAARKNLKSMNLKGNPLAGFGQPLGQPSLSGLGPKFGINPLGLSNMSSEDHQTLSKEMAKLDPKFEENLINEVEELEEKLEREFKQFEEERKINHEKNMKKYKTDFENSLSEFKTNKSSTSSYEKLLKEEKERIKERLKEAYEDRFKDEFVDVEKQEEKKYNEFVELYEEDNKIKIKKYETDKEQEFQEKIKKVENLEKNHEQNRREKEKERQSILVEMREKYQREDNQEIEEATKETYVKEINKIKDSHKEKLREFEQKLELEYQEMRKILGHDPNKLLQEMAEKKNRLKKISEQKLESLKKKEFQKVSQSFSENLEKLLKEAEIELENQHARELESQKEQMQEKLTSLKNNFEKEMKENNEKKIEQIYSEAKKSTTEYEKEKNKKILEIREKFISDIVSKSDTKNEELEIKLGLKEKEEMIENKEELIKSLERQVELESFVLKELRTSKTIATASDMDAELKRLINELNIIYKPDQFLKHEKIFNELKQKYKSDKQLLGSMMTQLQNSSLLPFYQKRVYDESSANKTSTTAILTKQYNSDVRIMRKNEELLNKYEVTLRKAELNDEKAIDELEHGEFVYEDISLRMNNRIGIDSNEPQLREIENSASPSSENKYYTEAVSNVSYQSIEDKIQQHSKFLTNIKAELNRKLYKVRNNNYFRV